jgi:ABC-type anion transport system duplicated permease subunit
MYTISKNTLQTDILYKQTPASNVDLSKSPITVVINKCAKCSSQSPSTIDSHSLEIARPAGRIIKTRKSQSQPRIQLKSKCRNMSPVLIVLVSLCIIWLLFATPAFLSSTSLRQRWAQVFSAEQHNLCTTFATFLRKITIIIIIIIITI